MGKGEGQLSPPPHPSLAVLAALPLEQCSSLCTFGEARRSRIRSTLELTDQFGGFISPPGNYQFFSEDGNQVKRTFDSAFSIFTSKKRNGVIEIRRIQECTNLRNGWSFMTTLTC